jgi:hypothetical protein
VLKKHDFNNEWNPNVHVRYRDNERIFIQAFWYETLIESAKKRNQAFFSVLFGTEKSYLAGFNFCIQTEWGAARLSETSGCGKLHRNRRF